MDLTNEGYVQVLRKARVVQRSRVDTLQIVEKGLTLGIDAVGIREVRGRAMTGG